MTQPTDEQQANTQKEIAHQSLLTLALTQKDVECKTNAVSDKFLVMKCGRGAGEDPFSKVKELITDFITDLINKVQLEASSEANHKSYRDDELTKAGDENVDRETQVATHSSKREAAVSQFRVLIDMIVDAPIAL